MSQALDSNTCVAAEPLALRVTDQSMEPEFQRGCIVVIDPTGIVKDGAYVLAEVSGQLIFRTLRLEGNLVWLEALHEHYPRLELDEGIAAVKGIVVQRAGARRRYHKRYD